MGFQCCEESPPRRDFAIFLHFQVIGASKGFQKEDGSTEPRSNVEGTVLEVPLTGTAIPVSLGLSPRDTYDFAECPVDQHVDTLCTLTNLCATLPVTFQFRRIAHFLAKPAKGKIKPGKSQDVIFSFAPNQVGVFKPTQYIDVMGHVADNQNPFLIHPQVIYSLPVNFRGSSDPVTTKKQPVFNPGITPKITNEVGLYVDTKMQSAGKIPQAATLNSQGTKIHQHNLQGGQTDKQALVAYPNDRAQSVRPSNREENYKTLFTRTKRHTYVDSDYAYTDQEILAVHTHKSQYEEYVDTLRETRKLQKDSRDFKKTNNAMDIAIKPAAGLRPKTLTQAEVGPDPPAAKPPNMAFSLLSTKDLATKESLTRSKVKDGLNAVPTTAKEKADCLRILSPQDLHQVIIGPPTVDFGSVCLKSVIQKDLSIVNNLDRYIHVVVRVDCRELRQTSPLSQVIPPTSKAIVPLIFESNIKGKFQRSLDYTVNASYKNHLTVFADVVPVALELSEEQLLLEPQVGLPSDAGIRGVITLKNKLNYPAEFTWSPILGEKGTAFSVRPASGLVESFTELDCEVVFHPSYMAPEDGEFVLQIHGGNTLKLKCAAKLGVTNVTFIDRRIMFGQVPLHQTTTRTAMLKNNSLNHAYFQVLDPNPFPGLSVSPIHGVVPVGGVAELKIHLTPNAVMKFDTRVSISIRGWKTLELRMGGTVEPPCVDIDLPSFNFGGVYCGSSLTVPFKLKNKVHTKARMEFNLSRYSDFTLEFPKWQSADDYSFHLMNPGLYTVTLKGNESVDCKLVFKPTEVASYDFIMPVTINQTGAPTPAPTPFPSTPTPSNKSMVSSQHIIVPRPILVHVETPSRKVVATALRQPLQLSCHQLDFSLSPLNHELASSSGIGQSKGILLVNNSDKTLHWAVDLNKGNQVLEEGVFKFLHPSGMPFLNHGGRGVEGSLESGQTVTLGVIFCPDKPGHYEVELPVVLNEDFDRPYQHIHLVGELKRPYVWFDPLAIVLTPVPLDTDITADVLVMAMDYTKSASLTAEVPEVECEDGSKLSPLTVTFLETNEVKACSSAEGESVEFSLPCRVTFNSPKPLSFSQPIIFSDDLGNKFSLMVTATADNCLLSCYPFLAQHRSDHQIVCEKGMALRGRQTASRESENIGEAVLLPCESPHRPSSRPSTTATSSNFEVSSSSFENSSHSNTADSTLPSTPRDGAVNKFVGEQSEQQSHSRRDLQSRSLGSAVFPEEDTEEGLFHTEVLVAAQRWFSSQGWPGGPNPISIPEALRSGISKKPAEEKVTNAKGGSFESNNLKKEFRTIYDMIAHLCGRTIPGIPINSSLPAEPLERAKQVYWQHSTLLTFLKAQGACVATVRPEYLMEPQDYKHWVQLQRDLETQRNKTGRRDIRVRTEQDEAIEDELFEAVSKRAWVDVLLQILKVLFLSKITPRQFKSMPSPYKSSSMPSVDTDPLCSNVYSLSERIVLLWLNHNYEQQRHHIWRDSTKGGVPPSRWVVNFDFDLLDGLVLAATLAAHVPFLVKSHLQDMYTHPATAEQCLHNALKVINAMRHIGIDYDIQAIDITDPNPISLMLLCVHFYFNLPQYIAKTTVTFLGALQERVARQVKLSNPSSKPLIYHAILAGPDSEDFLLPKGDTITIPPKSSLSVAVEHTGRFMRQAECVLVLVGRRQGSNVGSTMVFSLKSQIDNITPKTTVCVDSPCYSLQKLCLEVTNPFPRGGMFRVGLVEGTDESQDITASQTSLKAKKKKTKVVRSKINTGKDRADSPEEEKTLPLLLMTKTGQQNESGLSSFHSSRQTALIDTGATVTIDVDFLPFRLGKMQCSVVFSNDDIGEFVYCIEATSTTPLSLALPFRPSAHSVRISSAAAGLGSKTRPPADNVVYWKCESNQELKEVLTLPLANAAKDRALMIVAQQNMSPQELERRKLTGTLSSGALTANAVELLSKSKSATSLNKTIDSKTLKFTIELDSSDFSAPSKISVPNPTYQESQRKVTQRGNSAPLTGSRSELGLPSSDGTFNLPVTFAARLPGVYPCNIVLKGEEDVRVYRIECTVVPEGSEATMDFSTPIHQPIEQDIPVVNQTNHDWTMQAQISGEGFSGPRTIIAKAYQTTKYPLVFRPNYEGNVQGKLILSNKEDHIENIFHLIGVGEKPLPLEHIVIRCEAKQSECQEFKVPNVTKKKLYYKVETDVPHVCGAEYISVLPGQTELYKLSVTPLRRGTSKGIIAFVAGHNPMKEVDSDGEDVEEDEDEKLIGYRAWYSVELIVEPPKAERTLDICCACQKQAILEVGVNNPTTKEMTLEASVTGDCLSGPSSITLPPKARGRYELVYSPAIVGQQQGRLIFFHEAVGEFWYELSLTADKPAPSTLPPMECELGRYSRTTLTLTNPTMEHLQLIPTISNTNNFSLERDNEQPIQLPPHSTIHVLLVFMPSTLGTGDHTARVSFHCEQLGEWVYFISGTGILPQCQDPVSVTCMAGSSNTLIIPFRNPMDIAVLASVQLKDMDDETRKALDTLPSTLDSPFSLLLKQTQDIRLGPKSILDIPVSFAPQHMRMFEADVRVVVKKEAGGKWFVTPSMELRAEERGMAGWDTSEVSWQYPVRGYPEHEQASQDNQPVALQCMARQRLEERLEVALSGVAPSAGGPKRSIRTRAVTPKNEAPRIPEGVVVAEGLTPAEEFTHSLLFSQDEARQDLDPAIALKLIRQQRHPDTGLVTLVFDVIFSPNKTMSHEVQLLVQGATGGLWRFPLSFSATEPEPDDMILVEAQGLGQESCVGIRLTSQTRQPLPYSAYFLGGSDPELSVTPQNGELLPVGTRGTLLQIHFTPLKYGKVHIGKLVVQCPDIQWTYSVRGVLPEYQPPRGHSSQPMAGPHPDPRHRSQNKNYVRNNLRLTTTAVSSPIKGAPILQRQKLNQLVLG